jgi:hypothetical protein
MLTLLARNKVEDFDKWMALYETQRGELAAFGVTHDLLTKPFDLGMIVTTERKVVE